MNLLTTTRAVIAGTVLTGLLALGPEDRGYWITWIGWLSLLMVAATFILSLMGKLAHAEWLGVIVVFLVLSQILSFLPDKFHGLPFQACVASLVVFLAWAVIETAFFPGGISEAKKEEGP